LLLTWGIAIVVSFDSTSRAAFSGQNMEVAGYPSSTSATGEDGRTRTMKIELFSGDPVDLSALNPGERLVVSGTGFDSSRGIYVAICVIPEEVGARPGPCLGGIPDRQDNSGKGAGAPEFAASNWINNDWAWRLLGARGFDDLEAGSFSAYIEVPRAVEGETNCFRRGCGVFTRNDHTATEDRGQDVFLPIRFAP